MCIRDRAAAATEATDTPSTAQASDGGALDAVSYTHLDVYKRQDRAFAETSPLARLGERVILRPDVADVIRAAYAPAMPVVARVPAHALRRAARVG